MLVDVDQQQQHPSHLGPYFFEAGADAASLLTGHTWTIHSVSPFGRSSSSSSSSSFVRLLYPIRQSDNELLKGKNGKNNNDDDNNDDDDEDSWRLPTSASSSSLSFFFRSLEKLEGQASRTIQRQVSRQRRNPTRVFFSTTQHEENESNNDNNNNDNNNADDEQEDGAINHQDEYDIDGDYVRLRWITLENHHLLRRQESSSSSSQDYSDCDDDNDHAMSSLSVVANDPEADYHLRKPFGLSAPSTRKRRRTTTAQVANEEEEDMNNNNNHHQKPAAAVKRTAVARGEYHLLAEVMIQEQFSAAVLFCFASYSYQTTTTTTTTLTKASSRRPPPPTKKTSSVLTTSSLLSLFDTAPPPPSPVSMKKQSTKQQQQQQHRRSYRRRLARNSYHGPVVTGFSYCLARGKKVNCERLWQWMESLTSCSIGRPPVGPSPTELARAVAQWTTQYELLQQQQQVVNTGNNVAAAAGKQHQYHHHHSNNKPLVLVFRVPAIVAGTGIDLLETTVPPSALVQLCRDMIQERPKRRQRRHVASTIDRSTSKHRQHHDHDFHNHITKTIDPDGLPILQAIQYHIREAYRIDLTRFTLVQASCAVASWGCDGRCKLHAAAAAAAVSVHSSSPPEQQHHHHTGAELLLHNVLWEVERMVFDRQGLQV